MTFGEESAAETSAMRRIFPILFLFLIGTALSAGGYIVPDGLNQGNPCRCNQFAAVTRLPQRLRTGGVGGEVKTEGGFVSGVGFDVKDRKILRSITTAVKLLPTASPCTRASGTRDSLISSWRVLQRLPASKQSPPN